MIRASQLKERRAKVFTVQDLEALLIKVSDCGLYSFQFYVKAYVLDGRKTFQLENGQGCVVEMLRKHGYTVKLLECWDARQGGQQLVEVGW